MKKTQNQMILNDLIRGRKITALESLERHGCMRLASRIHELKNEGWEIAKKEVIKNGKRYVAYFLKGGKAAWASTRIQRNEPSKKPKQEYQNWFIVAALIGNLP